MKKLSLSHTMMTILFIGSALFALTSCSKEKGCPIGYIGDNCNQAIRDLIIGTYQASDTNVNNPAVVKNYGLSIVAGDTGILSVYVKGISKFNQTQVLGSAGWLGDTSAMLYIDSAAANTTIMVTVAYGFLSADTMKVNYAIDSSGVETGYRCIWVKQ